jgi:hypothetical protein
MFAVAARYDQADLPPLDPGCLWEAGLEYMIQAREVLSTPLCLLLSIAINIFIFPKTAFTIIAEEQRVRPSCF